MKYQFKKGQRVRMTQQAIKQRLAPHGRELPCSGTVVNIQPPLAVKVRRDGTKVAQYYHVKFWTPK